MNRSRTARALRRLLAALVGLAAIAVIVASPLLMRPLIGYGQWPTLGAIGDTYGGVAAIASGLALIGVAGSLVVQRRQHRVEREYAFREYYRELLRMAMDNPAYQACWGPSMNAGALPADVDLYTTMIIGYWHAGWVVGAFNEARLRVALRRFFDGEVGRSVWRVGDPRRTQGRDRRSRAFFQIADDEYRRAEAAGAPVPAVPPTPVAPAVRTATPRPRSRTGATLGAAAAGLAVGWLVAELGRRRRPNSRLS